MAALIEQDDLAISLYNRYLEHVISQYGPTHLAVSDAYVHLSRVHTSFGDLKQV